jgi:hypothetical protein
VNDAVASVFGVALLVLSLPGMATVGAGAPAADSAQPSGTFGTVGANEDAANETVRHQNPDEYDGDTDDDQLESWLSDRLSSQLEDSTVSLSEGQYDTARSAVGDEYDERLEQYVEVAGETEGSDDDEPTEDDEPNSTEEAYQSAGEEQERLADRVEEYEETRAEYEAALEEGDGERAHDLARELEELYAEIDDASGTLVTSYELITIETDEDLTDASEAVNETRSDIETEQTVVRDEQFVETELHLETDGQAASFSDPLVVQGDIRTADGSTIEDEEIQLLVDGEPVTVDSSSGEWWSEDADGGFELEYQPTAEALDTETITVEYIPDAASPHLRSEEQVDVTIEQDEPTISNLETSDEVAYGDSLSISGEVAVDDVPVDGVPLAVTVDGESLGTLNATDGTFEGTGEIPATVSDGEQTVSISLPFEEQALAATTAESPVTVDETETDLTVDATAVGEDELAFDGRLETAGGDGVEGEQIRIQVDGETVETATTDADGEFADTVAFPSTTDDEVTVTAVYEGEETSLTAATAEATTPMPGEGSGLLDTLPSAALPVLGALFAVVVLTAVAWWRRRSESDSTSDPVAAGSTGEDQETGPSISARALADALVVQATEQLAAGRADSAVRSCYAAVRYARGAAFGGAGGLTHWEFYRSQAADDASADADQLRELIEAYERAAFTADSVPEPAARRILEWTQELCEADGDSDGATGPESVRPSDD